MHFGQYSLTVINGNISLPYSFDTSSYAWYLVGSSDQKLHLVIAPAPAHIPDFDLLSDQGEFILDENNNWALPQAFVNYLGNQSIVLCALGSYFEIHAEDDFYQDTETIAQLLDDLLQNL